MLDKDIDIEVIQEREMTGSEIESMVSILFSWWRREFEENNTKNKPQKDGSAFE